LVFCHPKRNGLADPSLIAWVPALRIEVKHTDSYVPEAAKSLTNRKRDAADRNSHCDRWLLRFATNRNESQEIRAFGGLALKRRKGGL
jgi:hypothetical protein